MGPYQPYQQPGPQPPAYPPPYPASPGVPARPARAQSGAVVVLSVVLAALVLLWIAGAYVLYTYAPADFGVPPSGDGQSLQTTTTGGARSATGSG
jgi:hypothetical protein